MRNQLETRYDAGAGLGGLQEGYLQFRSTEHVSLPVDPLQGFSVLRFLEDGHPAQVDPFGSPIIPDFGNCLFWEDAGPAAEKSD